MKRISLLLIGLLAIIFPLNVYANSNSVIAIDQVTSSYSNECKDGWTCQYYVGALRFTFVNSEGKGISASYDFSTQRSGWANSTQFVYNVASGDRSKMSGTTSFGGKTLGDLKDFSTFIGKYNFYIDKLASRENDPIVGIKSTLATSGDTGGWAKNSWTSEAKWFEDLTKPTLSENQYRANVEAFSLALQDMYSDFNAEAMKLTIQEGCVKGEEVYIQVEPMYMWYTQGKAAIYGTLRDIVTFYYENRTAENISTTITYINSTKRNFKTSLHYNKKINDKFTGYEPVTKGAYTFVSKESLNDKVGYAVGLDWINDERNGCNSCKYENGKFIYNDEEVTKFESPFKTLYEYVLSKSEDGGLNCCGTLSKAIEKKDSSVTDELKEYYDYYCKLTGDACTEKDFPNIPDHVYYCPDGKRCDEATFKKQCDVPDDCDDDPEGNPGNKCCTDDPIEQGWIDGDVNNCCTDGTKSEAHEYDLDDLFCNNEYLGVDNYQMKCGADYYVQDDTDLNDDYCHMYCTERISVEIPGSIAAISGRYFKLTTTSKGTTSSYIEGYKRCRIRIQYDKWESDYYDYVEQEKDAYNSFQENKAYQLLYEKAEKEVIKNQKETSTINCSCTCYYWATVSDGKGGTKKEQRSHVITDKDTCDIEFNKYPFKKMFDIYPVDIDDKYRDSCENIYDAIQFKEDKSYKTQHNDWSSWEIDPSISKCNQKTSSMQVYKSDSLCGCNLTCSRTATEAEGRREDVHTVRANYNTKADADNQTYDTASKFAKDLEKDIDVCDNYFTNPEYKGSNAEENYKLNSTQNFYYTQIYMDTYGYLQLDEIYVDFDIIPGCKTDPTVTTGPDSEDKLSANQYSSKKYGNGQEKMTDFKEGKLDYEKTATGYKKYRDDEYKAEKIFTTDAKYHATCSWNELENNLYTLVPTGAVTSTEEGVNFTEHNQEYTVYLTTLEGTYETYWDIHGLGTPRRKGDTAGRFDQYFLEAGKTCSNDDPMNRTMLTCKIRTEHEVVLTGYCNGSNGSDTTTDPDDCDPYKEGYRLFNFKVVDAANLFPSGVQTVDGAIAYNWTSTTLGQQALSQIQAAGVSGKTYSPENLTYSYVLTPTDMGHIKNYNAQQVDEGGYSDFNLECNKALCTAGACSQCKSTFLYKLANGEVEYSGSRHNVSGWSNKDKDITSIRKLYGWN